jgi:alkylhydroperoxidase family enzyme
MIDNEGGLMTWVETDPSAGGLPHVLASHSLNQDALSAHQTLYRTLMFGPSDLTRAEREAIAVCVSAANGCHY